VHESIGSIVWQKISEQINSSIAGLILIMAQDLSLQFDSVIQTPTLVTSAEESGQIQVTVTNSGTEGVTSASLNLYASTDATLDDAILNTNSDRIEGTDINLLRGTDELLGTIGNLNLAPGESRALILDFSSDNFRAPSVVSPGAYNLIAEIDPNNIISESNEGNNQAVQFISSANTDPIIDWTSTWLNIAQAEGQADRANGVSLTDDGDIPGVAPPIQGRDGAILHIAIFDAVNAISGDRQGYLEGLDAPAGASAEAAAVGAAYGVLSELYPEYQELLDEQRVRSLDGINDSEAAETSGYEFGLSVAQQILDLRANDGVAEAQVNYEPGSEPGDYQETVRIDPATGELVGDVSLLPNFGDVDTFALENSDDFLPDGPPEYGSEEFLAELEQIAQLGGRFDTANTDVTRTEDQTEIAEFWAYDRIDTFRPPGQLYEVAQNVAIQEGNTLEENALLFAQLSTAFADAGIVAWDAKYTYEQARPITTVRELLDPDWQPLLDTPPFPDYISGHSTFGGAAATVLEHFFGEDISFEVSSQELPGITRSFSSVGDVSSFDQLAQEDSLSRVYGGVHYLSSTTDGVETGNEIAQYVVDNLFV
jgi:hypothetical protein